MSVFKVALGICGLSISEAAEFLGLSESLVKHYSAGTRQPSGAVWHALAVLYDQITEVSEHALDAFERDEITPEGVQDIAVREHGSPLPKPALDAAAAMFILTRTYSSEGSIMEDKKKEIVAVTMQRGDTRPFPSVLKFYVPWFDSNALHALPQDIEAQIFTALRQTIIAQNRALEHSGLGQADAKQFFDELELLAIFTTDRAKALLNFWDNPLNLSEHFGYTKAKS